MPDDGLTGATAAPETSAAATATPSDAAASLTAETPSADPYATLADLDVEEIIRRHPKLQGKVGSLAQQQAQRLHQQYLREQQAVEEARQEQARRAELRELARTDPDRLAETTLRNLSQEEAKARETALWQQFQRETGGQLEAQFNAFYQQPVVQHLWQTADDTTRAKLDWRNYDSVGEWNAACVDVLAEQRAEAKAAERAKKLVEAAEKSGRVEEMAGEGGGGVDLGLGGMVEGGRRFRRSEIDPHSPTYMGREQYRKLAKAIDYQIDNGLLIQD